MTETLSIVTVVHPANVDRMEDLHASIIGQRMPSGWEWEWLIRGSGVSAAALGHVVEDPRVRFGEDAALERPAVSRNVAMSYATGPILKVIDSDDLLLSGALARDIEILDSDPLLGWVTSAALDLMPDGTQHLGDRANHETGRLPRGWVLDQLKAHNWQLPVLPGTLCIRRYLAIMVNGWIELPGTGDIGLLVAANEIRDGYYVAEPSIQYNRHAGQVSIDEMETDTEQRRQGHSFIEQRGEALRRMYGS